jgi:hypothetical protein
MSRLTKIAWTLMAFTLVGLAACGSGTTTSDSSLAYTQIWKTVEAVQTKTGIVVSPTPLVTNTPLTSPTSRPTNTPLLSATPLPGTPSATVFAVNTLSSPTSLQSASCDNMTGVADVTYPDGSVLAAGTIFVKTWRVKNLGPCTWNQDYRLIFGWGGTGTNWDTTPSSHLSALVLPGDTVEISVSLAAPTNPGNYAAAFRLQNAKGYNFGPAQTVVIVVK